MNETYFTELARRLQKEGIATGPVEKACLPVVVEGRKALWVQSWGGVILNAGAAGDPAVDRVYDKVSGISAQVHEYITAMETAPVLKADGLHEDFRLLAEFNGVVLAGQELERNWGYKFVTWRRTADRTGVVQGSYYHNDYDGAKLDFASRAGLVQEQRQFTDTQLTELYRCIHETLDSEYPITEERRKTLTEAAAQIERAVDDLEERVEQSNQRELEAADGQTDGGPEWGMSP